jgi:hypothetical protein
MKVTTLNILRVPLISDIAPISSMSCFIASD